jgi:hypothetical protein
MTGHHPTLRAWARVLLLAALAFTISWLITKELRWATVTALIVLISGVTPPWATVRRRMKDEPRAP